MIVVTLLIIVLWIGLPLYLVGACLFYWWKKRRPGIVFWIVNPILAVLWLFTIILAVHGHNAAVATAAPSNTAAPASSSNQSTPAQALPADEMGIVQAASAIYTTGWSNASDGNSWLNASEADKQMFCTLISKSSVNNHTSAYFYTNFNNSYDPTSQNSLKISLIVTIAKLDAINPNASYPTLLGTSWARYEVLHSGDNDLKMIIVPWQDGHTFIHDQKLQADGSYSFSGADGPWDGDYQTFTATTTVSGNAFTIQITAPSPSTQTGTFQVSVDGQELDLTVNGATPVRYIRAATLVNSIPF
jgi:hypothetical protein